MNDAILDLLETISGNANSEFRNSSDPERNSEFENGSTILQK
jgi:hypothetical protein